MAGSSATASIKMLIVILSLAAMPALAFAQGTGGTGSTGSTSGVARSPTPPPGTNSLGTAAIVRRERGARHDDRDWLG